MNVVEECGYNPNTVSKEVERIGKTMANLIYDIFYSEEPVVDAKAKELDEMEEEEKEKMHKKRKQFHTKQNYRYQRNIKRNI